MPVQERRLKDLISIGPAMLRDFELLGIRSVQQLARQDPARLFRKLCRITGQQMDICCQDVHVASGHIQIVDVWFAPFHRCSF